MATRFLERSAELLPGKAEYAGNVAAIHVDSDDEKVKFYDRTADVTRELYDGRDKVITPTGAVALLASQSGSDIYLNAAAGFAITLPAPAPGLNFRFTVGAAFATTNFTVVTAAGANILQGRAIVNSVRIDCAAQDTINFVATAETIGDYVELWSDGTSWFVQGDADLAGGITFTAT